MYIGKGRCACDMLGVRVWKRWVYISSRAIGVKGLKLVLVGA